jgi:hypothetical protein
MAPHLLHGRNKREDMRRNDRSGTASGSENGADRRGRRTDRTLGRSSRLAARGRAPARTNSQGHPSGRRRQRACGTRIAPPVRERGLLALRPAHSRRTQAVMDRTIVETKLESLRRAVRFRNPAVHNYGVVDRQSCSRSQRAICPTSKTSRARYPCTAFADPGRTTPGHSPTFASSGSPCHSIS